MSAFALSMKFLIGFLTAFASTAVNGDYTIYTPEQIHIAIGAKLNSMSVQWAAAHDDSVKIGSTVMWGLSSDNLDSTNEGESVSWFRGCLLFTFCCRGLLCEQGRDRQERVLWIRIGRSRI